MYKREWKIDDSNFITYDLGLTAYAVITCNGVQKIKKRSLGVKDKFEFKTDNNKQIVIESNNTGIKPELKLYVNGNIILDNESREERRCIGCDNLISSNKNNCEKCGAEIPTVKDILNLKTLKPASQMYFTFIIGSLLGILLPFIFKLTLSNQEIKSLSFFEEYDFLMSGSISIIFYFLMYVYFKKNPVRSVYMTLCLHWSIVVLGSFIFPQEIKISSFWTMVYIWASWRGISSIREYRRLNRE